MRFPAQVFHTFFDTEAGCVDIAAVSRFSYIHLMFLVNQTLHSWIIFVVEQNFWRLSGMLIFWKATNQVMSSHSSLFCWVMLSQVNEVNFHLWITANFQVRMNIEQTKQDFILCLYHNTHPFTHWLNRRKHKPNIWQNELASNQTIKQTNKQTNK